MLHGEFLLLRMISRDNRNQWENLACSDFLPWASCNLQDSAEFLGVLGQLSLLLNYPWISMLTTTATRRVVIKGSFAKIFVSSVAFYFYVFNLRLLVAADICLVRDFSVVLTEVKLNRRLGFIMMWELGLGF